MRDRINQWKRNHSPSRWEPVLPSLEREDYDTETIDSQLAETVAITSASENAPETLDNSGGVWSPSTVRQSAAEKSEIFKPGSKASELSSAKAC